MYGFISHQLVEQGAARPRRVRTPRWRKLISLQEPASGPPSPLAPVVGVYGRGRHLLHALPVYLPDSRAAGGLIVVLRHEPREDLRLAAETSLFVARSAGPRPACRSAPGTARHFVRHSLRCTTIELVGGRLVSASTITISFSRAKFWLSARRQRRTGLWTLTIQSLRAG